MRRRPAPRVWLAVAVALASTTPARAQAGDSLQASDATDALEAIAIEDDDADPESLLEHLESLRDYPVDINTAAAAELSGVPGISRIAAGAIVDHRRRNGPFASVGALAQVPHLDDAGLAAARPYITAGTSSSSRTQGVVGMARRLRPSATLRVHRRLETPSGYFGDDSVRAYRGSPLRVLTRLQARSGRNLVANLTLEKDPGEAFADNGLGYDHVSATVGLLSAGRVEALVVGDFVADFGQGVALGRRGGMGKGSEPTRGPLRAGRGLRPFTSADETAYLRGAGATVAPFPFVAVTAFASRRRVDATVDSAGVTSLAADGLHRTTRELRRERVLGETVFGGAVALRLAAPSRQLRVGAAGYRLRYDEPIIPTARPDSRYALAGAGASALSVYADARAGVYEAFAEVARSGTGAIAGIAGLGAALAPRSEVLVVFRRYPADFVSPRGAPFGERDAGQNETGIYLGLRAAPAQTVVVAGYVDVYSFPWLRFNVPRPSAGRDGLLRAEYQPRRWLRLQLQARAESADAGADATDSRGAVVGSLELRDRRSARLQAEFDASRTLRLRVRVEAVRAGAGHESHAGVLFLQDVRWTVISGVRLDARLIVFESDDFSSRLYQLESDVAGAFALPALQGRGSRSYVLLTLTPLARLSVQAKLAATFLEDSVRHGSGPDTVEGHRASEAGLQVRWEL